MNASPHHCTATGPTLGQLLLALAFAVVCFALGRSVGVTNARHAMPLACLVDSSAGATAGGR